MSWPIWPIPPGDWKIDDPVITEEDYKRAKHCVMHLQVINRDDPDVPGIETYMDAYREANWEEGELDFYYGRSKVRVGRFVIE